MANERIKFNEAHEASIKQDDAWWDIFLEDLFALHTDIKLFTVGHGLKMKTED